MKVLCMYSNIVAFVDGIAYVSVKTCKINYTWYDSNCSFTLPWGFPYSMLNPFFWLPNIFSCVCTGWTHQFDTEFLWSTYHTIPAFLIYLLNYLLLFRNEAFLKRMHQTRKKFKSVLDILSWNPAKLFTLKKKKLKWLMKGSMEEEDSSGRRRIEWWHC